MKLYHKAFLYRHKWIQPYLQKVLGGIDAVTFLAALALIGGVVYEHGFIISEGAEADLGVLYRTVWGVFLVQTTMHIGLAYRETLKKYRTFTWVLNILLYLTLIPVIFFEPESGALKYFWLFLNNRIFQLILLLLLSLLRLSSGVIGLLGKRTNPSLILAGSFFLIICIGTGLLMLPRCTVDGISWVNALFVSTSAVCVTGLVPVDVATTFTSLGQLVIIILIQIGGLGVMTLTCFFAMFFMGNTSVYNQLAVRDMISSDSLSSLLSTVIYILFFTLVIEGAGMLVLFLSIHGTLGMTVQQEMVFAAFHSISAFCNAGFSTLSENLGNPLVMQHHNLLYITISVLIILGGIGFPILVNFKHIAGYHLKRLFYFIRTGKRDRQRIRHLYNLNTKIVLLTTLILLTGGTIAILLFEWNGAFAGMSMPDKWVQAFFNATCPRTAGFTSIGLTSFSLQSLLLMLLLMFIGGAAQSTAGGVKVNAFAAAVLSLFAVIRGKNRVEVFRRQLSVDSIRRSNATLVMYLMILFLGVFVLSVLGRVGVITIVLGFVPPQKHTKYKYPDDNLIIN